MSLPYSGAPGDAAGRMQWEGVGGLCLQGRLPDGKERPWRPGQGAVPVVSDIFQGEEVVTEEETVTQEVVEDELEVWGSSGRK